MGTAIRVFAAWFLVTLLVAVAFVLYYQPLPGLFFLVVVAAGMAMFVAPALHIALRRKGSLGPVSSVVVVLLALLLAVLALGASGRFNFT